VNTPTGLNFLLLAYGYTSGSVALDESSEITDTKVQVHAAFVSYARSLDISGLSGKVLMVLPVADASGQATVAGQGESRTIVGLADPVLRASVNVYGAPALSLKEFASYQPKLVVGIGMLVSAPLGQYDPTKLLNVGTHRWSFRPELGVSEVWGHLTLEVISAITVFTTNDDFFAGHTLQKAPIYSFQGHVIYELSSTLWAAFDATYYLGGRTTVDGEPGPEPGNIRLGVTTALSLTRRHSIKLTGSTGVYERTNNSFWAVAIAGQYRWGGGL
jgi:hypothetical protein